MDKQTTDLMSEIERELACWHATHPRATFGELEVAVEQQLHRLRAQLLEERVEATYHEDHPACPSCGTTMVLRGQHERGLVVQGDEVVHLKRAYVVCPECGTGLFPPG